MQDLRELTYGTVSNMVLSDAQASMPSGGDSAKDATQADIDVFAR